MTLREEAERASKIRDAFTQFTSRCSPPDVQDIDRAIAELSRLICDLRRIAEIVSFHDVVYPQGFQEHLQRVHQAITFTLQKVWLALGRMANGRRMFLPEDYQKTWTEITLECHFVNGQSLHRQLEGYRRHLEWLTAVIRRQDAGLDDPRRMREEIRQVRALQEARGGLTTDLEPLQTGMERLAVDQVAPKKPSFERQRPLSPTASTSSSKTDNPKFGTPWAPSPPMSPAATFSSISQVSSIPSVENESTHWAKQVFKNMSSTPLPRANEQTRYHEDSGLPQRKSPKPEYEAVLTFQYRSEHFSFIMYCRPSDYRAKMLVHYRDRKGYRGEACQPLDALHLLREGSLLRVCGRGSNGRSISWVTLKFTTYEKLVLFASTFIAMRLQDDARRPGTPSDDELKDEVGEYGGRILENGYEHALRVYRDKITGAVRLQASVFETDLDRMPIWTAFITHSLMSPEWCTRVDRKTIYLAQLQLHIFSSEYQPQLAPSGNFVLRFELESDAKDFMEVLKILRSKRPR